MEKKRIITPELPAGVQDRGPRDMIAWRRMMEIIIRVFQQFGFEPLGTSIMHYLDVLTGDEVGEIRSNMFLPLKTDTYETVVAAAQASEQQRHLDAASKLSASGIIRKRALALRYDLTVPLARWIAAHINDLKFPFRRWDTGPVFRADPPSHGRLREFTQCDIDIAGDPSPRADAEIMAVIYAVLEALGFEQRFTIRVNSRRIHTGLPEYAGFDPALLSRVLVELDKADRDGFDSVLTMLQRPADADSNPGVGLDATAAQKVIDFCQLSGDNNVKFDAASAMLTNSTAQAGIRELKEVLALAQLMGVNSSNMRLDFSLARGLNYYTGPIFETVLGEVSDIGSIFSGGRFDGQVALYCERQIPATGASIGLSRLFLAWQEMGRVTQSSVAQVMIAVVQEDLYPRYYEIAAKLRTLGANVLVYSGEDMALRDQLGYASGKGIPYVVIAGDNELQGNEVTVRDMGQGQQSCMPIGQLEAFVARMVGD